MKLMPLQYSQFHTVYVILYFKQTQWRIQVGGGVKVKKVDLYSAFIVVPHTQVAQVRITQCYLQITPYLPHLG